MIKVKREGILLAPTENAFEKRAVLNPATLRVGDEVVMLYRAVDLQGISSIGSCRFLGPVNLLERRTQPLLCPSKTQESRGMEDPRLVAINGQYLLSYTAYDGYNALGAIAVSPDLKTFQRLGVIVPKIVFPDFRSLAEKQGSLNPKYARFAHDKLLYHGKKKLLVWDKDLIFFPRRINGQLYCIHRIKPDIQIAFAGDLQAFNQKYWHRYLSHFQSNILLRPKFPHEASYIGGGCPPLETAYGWVLIYHGVRDTPPGL